MTTNIQWFLKVLSAGTPVSYLAYSNDVVPYNWENRVSNRLRNKRPDNNPPRLSQLSLPSNMSTLLSSVCRELFKTLSVLCNIHSFKLCLYPHGSFSDRVSRQPFIVRPQEG